MNQSFVSIPHLMEAKAVLFSLHFQLFYTNGNFDSTFMARDKMFPHAHVYMSSVMLRVYQRMVQFV